MRIPDQVICSYLKKKDTKGWKYLFEEYYRPLVLWADTFLNDIALAEDLVQEFFVKLWEQELVSSLLLATLKSYLHTKSIILGTSLLIAGLFLAQKPVSVECRTLPGLLRRL